MGEDQNLNKTTRKTWGAINSKLARELGLPSLSATHYPRQVTFGNSPTTVMEPYWENYVARGFMLADVDATQVDRVMKERLSLVEIGFREMHGIVELQRTTAKRPLSATALGKRSFDDMVTEAARRKVATYDNAVAELNARFQQAGVPLTYNSGYIQLAEDSLVEANIAAPFWSIVSSTLWKNVELEMHEALDRRDSGRHDGGLYAAQALESAIKVISSEKGWTRGTEAGAAHYVDNLVSEANGRFLEVWRGNAIKEFFRSVRNPLGHGAGSSAPVRPTVIETEWAIATSMTWIRYLIQHFKNTQSPA